MKRTARRILVLILVLAAAFGIYRLSIGQQYQITLPFTSLPAAPGLPELRAEHPEVLRAEVISRGDQTVTLEITPISPGESFVEILDASGNYSLLTILAVLPSRSVYDYTTGGFTGDMGLMIILSLFFLGLAGILLRAYFSMKGSAYYSYYTIIYIGYFFFALLTGLELLTLTLRRLFYGEVFTMLEAYSALCGASMNFFLITSPLLAAFALVMIVSNIFLLRHNRPRIQNLLAIIIALLILAGGAFVYWLYTRDFAGSVEEYRLDSTLQNTLSTVYVYFECLLAGAVICTLHAAHRRPSATRDVIIILGCWFRKDGTLPPLLRGRVDRALAVWREHLEKTGREAFLIPSGGQGPDEPMPEASAMEAYLRRRGIPDRLILPETRSSNTLQNMKFSGKVMEEHGLSGPVLFATTNYHVFRGGMWAARAGLNAEGVGSPTKWWFWPNAFVREWIGLITSRWKQELVLLLAMVLFFGALSMTLIQ